MPQSRKMVTLTIPDKGIVVSLPESTSGEVEILHNGKTLLDWKRGAMHSRSTRAKPTSRAKGGARRAAKSRSKGRARARAKAKTRTRTRTRARPLAGASA